MPLRSSLRKLFGSTYTDPTLAIEAVDMQTIMDDTAAPAAPPQVLDVEIVIPVYNEERALAATVRRLHEFLSRELPFSWQITIADNASTDRTPFIAQALAGEFDRVGVVRLEQKGRGRALRLAWSASSARVLAYMDVDLSTDLRALLPLIAPLLSGHSEVAIGSRLAPGAKVARGAKREVISRAYNLILRAVLRAKFTDAQCGFKAVRADVLEELLAHVHDESWFFDTELLVLAQRDGMRIHEVAVDWVDDPDSRVDIVPTALADLRGVVAVHAMHAGSGRRGRRADEHAGQAGAIRVDGQSRSDQHLPGRVGAVDDVAADVVLVLDRDLAGRAHTLGHDALPQPGGEALDLVEDCRLGVSGVARRHVGVGPHGMDVAGRAPGVGQVLLGDQDEWSPG